MSGLHGAEVPDCGSALGSGTTKARRLTSLHAGHVHRNGEVVQRRPRNSSHVRHQLVDAQHQPRCTTTTQVNYRTRTSESAKLLSKGDIMSHCPTTGENHHEAELSRHCVEYNLNSRLALIKLAVLVILLLLCNLKLSTSTTTTNYRYCFYSSLYNMPCSNMYTINPQQINV